MGTQAPISDLSQTTNVDNVVLFVADAVRFDALPAAIRDLGVTAKSVAASTFTGSSIPSLVTGEYPSTHRVWSFGDSLAAPPALFETDRTNSFDFDDEFHLQPEAIGGPARIPLSDLAEPFCYVYHDRGGHLPYDRPFEAYDDMREYLEAADGFDELRERYVRSVERCAERFQDLVTTLQERGLLDSTLVIFTSDHGELLGEYGGLVTHAVPMVPELVEVPVVLAGAGLPRGRDYGGLLSGADLTPAALGALGEPIPEAVDGTNLWATTPAPDRMVRSEIWKRTKYEYLTSYTAAGVWEANGGHVFNLEPRRRHLLYCLGVHLLKGPHAPLARSVSPTRYLDMFRPHLQRSVTYGTPSFGVDEARNAVPEFTEQDTPEGYKPDHDRLRQLGYLE